MSKEVSENDLNHAFNKARGFFRSYLAQELKLRIVPNLRFIFDDSLEYGQKMSDLIDQAKEADQAFIDQESNQNFDNQEENEPKKDKRKRLR